MLGNRRNRGTKIQESVTANVIPLVDIMFLLVLFFMLAADMTQRELEALPLPHAQSAIADESSEKRVVVHVVHRAESACPNDEKGLRCIAREHWETKLKGEVLAPALLAARLEGMREEWDREHDRGSAMVSAEKLSEMPLMIRADQAAPFGEVQGVLAIAGKLRIRKTSVGVLGSSENS